MHEGIDLHGAGRWEVNGRRGHCVEGNNGIIRLGMGVVYVKRRR